MNTPPSTTFEEFRQDALAQGCDEVLIRDWPAGTVLAQHAHPFSARALVVRGELWLRLGHDKERHLCVGDTFEVERDTLHAERYGPDGATFWVKRFH